MISHSSGCGLPCLVHGAGFCRACSFHDPETRSRAKVDLYSNLVSGDQVENSC